MPSNSYHDEDTYDVQAGAGPRRGGGRRGARRGHRHDDHHPGGTPPPSDSDDDSSATGGSGSDWDDVESEEDLYADVTRPEPDDLVRIKPGFQDRYVPRVLRSCPPEIQSHPVFARGMRIGVVCPEDDPALDNVSEDELAEYVPVRFFVVDDRASAVPYRRIELVPEEQLEIITRPFTAAEMVIAEGDIGTVDEVVTTLHVKPVPFPAAFAPYFPTDDKTPKMTFAEVDDILSLAPVEGRSGAAGSGGASHADPNRDDDDYGDESDGEQERAAVSSRKKHRHFAPSRRSKRHGGGRRHQHGHHRAPYPLSFDKYIESCDHIPQALFAPLHPFRTEACVVHRQTNLIGMVQQVTETTLVAFEDGAVAAVSDFSGFNQTTTGEPETDGKESAMVAPGQRCRFTREAEHALCFIVGDFATGANADGARDGIVISVVPFAVSCSFTTDAGSSWIVNEDCAPEDLIPVDYFYPEFTNVFSPGFRIDTGLRGVLLDAMHRSVDAADALPESEADRLKEHFSHHVSELETSAAADDNDQGIDTDIADSIAPTGPLDAELQANATENAKRTRPSDSAAPSQKPPPKATAESLRGVLRHSARDSADDVPSLRGSLSPLEYMMLYRYLCPPSTLPPCAAGCRAEDAGELRGRWRSFLAKVMKLLPYMVTVRSIDVKTTVVWNTGRVEHDVDGRTILLRQEADDADAVPPPEALRLVAPTSVHAALFPISMGTADGPRAITDRVSEYDLTHLPDEHCAATPGDVVLMKCKDDVDLERQLPQWQEPPRFIGRVLESQESDRVCVVHWMATEMHGADVTDRESFPDFSRPDDSDVAVRAARALDPLFGTLRVGGVLRVLNDGTAVVRWWDGTCERVPAPLLTVINFDNAPDDEVDEDEEDLLGSDNATPTGVPTTHQQPPSNGATATAATSGSSNPVVQAASAIQSWVRRKIGGDEGKATGDDDNASGDDTQPDKPVDDVASTTPTTTDAAASRDATADDRGTFVCVPAFTAHMLKEEADGSSGSFSPAEPKRFMKRVQTEWKQLQREVPAGVAVKVSEEAMHLMKVLIRGPIHTPYFQGIYAFDVLFPCEFPAKPPIVKHHAQQLRLNPNLYETGYVCLSVLGTWQGWAACEEWNPVSSNMLQVILALQAMVLNKEPYFNEPGFEESMGTERGRATSRLANEGYYLLKLQHFQRMATRPPPDWIFEIRQHVAEFAPRLFGRARKYLASSSADGKDATQQQPQEGAINSDGLVVPLSRGFHVSLERHVAAIAKQIDELIAQWRADDERYGDVGDTDAASP